MHLTSLQVLISVVLVALQIAIIIVMLGRKLNSSYPLFFSFMVFGCIASVGAILTYLYAHTQYQYVYWSSSTVLMLIGFGVLYEVFVNVMKPYSAVIDLGKMLFAWAALFLLLAAFLTALATSGSRPSRFIGCVELLDRCVHMMQIGMLMLLVLFEKRLNFSWRSSAMGIGLGMGVSAAMDLAVSYGELRFPELTLQLNIGHSICCIGVLAFWAFSLMSKQPERKTAADSPTRIILQRWNEALTGYGYGDVAYASHTTDSFLPNVERTVDRVLARKIVQ